MAALEITTHAPLDMFRRNIRLQPVQDVAQVKAGDYFFFHELAHRVVRVTPPRSADSVPGWIELDSTPTASDRIPAGAPLVKPKLPS